MSQKGGFPAFSSEAKIHILHPLLLLRALERLVEVSQGLTCETFPFYIFGLPFGQSVRSIHGGNKIVVSERGRRRQLEESLWASARENKCATPANGQADFTALISPLALKLGRNQREKLRLTRKASP